MLTMMVQPTPSRRAIDEAARAPRMPPTEPTARMVPTTAGLSCKRRYMKMSSTAKIMFVPRLLVAAQLTACLMMGLPKTASSPSRSPARTPDFSASKRVGAGFGSGLWISRTAIADAIGEPVSITIAAAPPTSWITSPAIPGPATWADDRVTLDPGVALDQVGPVDQRRQVGLVGDVEENREDAHHQGDGVHPVDRQDM